VPKAPYADIKGKAKVVYLKTRETGGKNTLFRPFLAYFGDFVFYFILWPSPGTYLA